MLVKLFHEYKKNALKRRYIFPQGKNNFLLRVVFSRYDKNYSGLLSLFLHVRKVYQTVGLS